MAPKKAAKKAAPTKGAATATASGRVGRKVRPGLPNTPPRRGPARKAKMTAIPADGIDTSADGDASPSPPLKAEGPPPKATRPARQSRRSPRITAAPAPQQDPPTVEEEDDDHITREGEIASDEFRDCAALAQVSREFEITLRHRKDVEGREMDGTGESVSVRVDLKVHVDPAPGFQSRLGYHAKISSRQSDEAPEELRQIGYIHSWRIDKPNSSTTHPENKTRWQADFLIPNPHTVDASGQETALCLQSLFNRNGAVKKAARAQSNVLDNDPLMFVQIVYLFRQFQGQGLLSHILTAYHELLLELPEWFSSNGSVVLVPGAPDGLRGLAWKSQDAADAEDILKGIYRAQGRYVVWAKQVHVGRGDDKVAITTMGRRQQPSEAESS